MIRVFASAASRRMARQGREKEDRRRRKLTARERFERLFQKENEQ